MGAHASEVINLLQKMSRLKNYSDTTWDSYDVIGVPLLFSILS